MSEVSDTWFVRYPDGRVARAANTTIVRQQVTIGKIPPNSSVRRSPDDEWTALEWTREFADLLEEVPAARRETKPQPAAESGDALDLGGEARPAAAEAGGLSARLDRSRLPTIGVRGMAHELLAALDSTLVRKKLTAAALAGLGAGLVLASWTQLPEAPFEQAAQWARTIVAVVLLLTIVTAATGMLTRMTYYELSRMRPARWREGTTGLTGTTFRIAAAQLLTAGVAILVIVYLRLAPRYLLELYPGGGGQTVAAALAALGMIVELVLWPIVSFALLLPPILVVEDCSIGKALSLWLRLLREDVGRVFLYEALALGLGLSATLLLALPWLALFLYEPVEFPQLLPALAFTRWVLAGLALAPLMAYLMVANVFIYINIRYETAPAGRR